MSVYVEKIRREERDRAAALVREVLSKFGPHSVLNQAFEILLQRLDTNPLPENAYEARFAPIHKVDYPPEQRRADDLADECERLASKLRLADQVRGKLERELDEIRAKGKR